jgi:hypothetical protein
VTNTKTNLTAIPCFIAMGCLATMGLGGNPVLVGATAKLAWIVVSGLSIATLIHPGKGVNNEKS